MMMNSPSHQERRAEDILRQYDGLIYQVARRIHARLPSDVKRVIAVDDLYQEGRLRTVMTKKEETLNKSFVVRFVYFACIDYIRKVGFLGRYEMAHFHVIGDFVDENGCMPTPEEFAQLAGVKEKTAELILRTLSPFTEGPVLTTFIPDITTDESTATPEENTEFFELVRLIRSKLTENVVNP